MKNRTNKLLFFLLLGIICVTLFPFLGLTDFHTKGEPREAVVSYAMIHSGNWILPENAGGDLAYKPPFFHWCVALASLPIGEVTEYTSRIPSAVALLFMALAFFLFFAKRIDPLKSFFATLILISSFEVHRAAMNARVDMLLTALIILAIFQLYFWWERGLKGIPFFGILFMSLATLTKGPVGIILPCLCAGVFLLLNKVSFWKSLLKLSLAAILSCIIPAIWYYLAYLQGGDAFVDLVMEENFGRFLGKMSYASHENPVYYNFLTMIAGWIPWTLLLILSLFVVEYKKGFSFVPQIKTRFVNWIKQVNRAKLYAFISMLLIFVFYCIPKSKRSVYLLPVYPFLALFITDWFFWLVNNKPKIGRIFGWIIASITSIALVLWLSIKLKLLAGPLFFTRNNGVKISQYMNEIAQDSIPFIGIVSLIVSILFIYNFIRTNRSAYQPIKYMGALVGLVFGLQILLDGMIQPAILNHKSIKTFAHEVETVVPQGPVYGYIPIDMLRFYIVNFYIGDRVLLFEKEMPQSGYLMVGDRTFSNDFEPKYGNDYRFEKIMRTPHNDTEIKDYIGLYRFEKK